MRVPDHESRLGDFAVVYCPDCRLGMTDPYPSEATVGRLYETRESGDFDRINPGPIDRLKDALAARQLCRLVPTDSAEVGAVLDYATGNGRFARAAARVFPSAAVDAVDYQEEPPALLRSPDESGKVRYSNVAKWERGETRYDLIVLRHVLEHTHRPVELLTRLGARLTNRGMLYVEVPNLDAGCALVFGRNWKGWYVPRHIFHYTRASLAEIAYSAGLDAAVGTSEMPLMGNTLAILTGLDKANPLVQAVGIVLHPVQLLIGMASGNPTCLTARCRPRACPAAIHH